MLIMKLKYMLLQHIDCMRYYTTSSVLANSTKNMLSIKIVLTHGDI